MKRVGILGGGQLSRMLALSSAHMGIDFSYFINTKEHSVDDLGKLYFGSFDDLSSLDTFLNEIDVLTFENENIPLAVFDYISNKVEIHPTPAALKNTQDRFLEKQLFEKLAIPTNHYANVEDIASIKTFVKEHGLPVILKKRQLGYDGRGQVRITTSQQIDALTPSQIENCIVESFVPFDREVSMIACRSKRQLAFYDINENQHHAGILHQTSNMINDPAAKQAQTYITRFMEEFGYYGTCSFEFFEHEGQLIANEIAPRVHNSGHWTIEGAKTSQFENHIRAILDLPLGSCDSVLECAMYNIISTMPPLNELLQLNPLAVHDYKKQERSLRKLGHVNFERSNRERLNYFDNKAQ